MTGRIFIALTILFWGGGSFLAKVALKGAGPVQTYLWEALGTLTIACAVALYFRRDMAAMLDGFGVAGYWFGILWGLGTVTFIVAMKYAPASAAVPLTGLYPAVTVILAAMFLGEAISLRGVIGIALAIGAAMLLG